MNFNILFDKVPLNWDFAPLKFLCNGSGQYGANIPATEYVQDGARFIRTTDILDDGSLKDEGVYLPTEKVLDFILQEGDFLISRSGTLGRACIYRSDMGKCAYAGYLVRFVFQSNQKPKYFFYLTKTPEFEVWLNRSTIEATIGNVNAEKYSNLIVPVPPPVEQKAIVAFLDREVSKIDQLITAKERLLTLLDEKRRALITHAVTRGLDSAVPLRDSGVAWIGRVPKHWETEYARWLLTEVDVRSIAGEEELLSVSHITGVTPRAEKDVNMFMAESLEGYKVCQPGDLVINTLWAWMGAMGVAFQEGIVSPSYHVYRPNTQLNPNYVDYLVRLPIFATEVTRYSKGVWSSRLRLYPQEFFQIVLPIPPLAEQKEIVHYLDQETAKVDNLKQALQKTIVLLQERRTALIAAAVSGQHPVADQS